MAKQTEIGYEVSKEWQDYQTGGTRIDAADLNHIEQGVTDACDAVDDMRTKRLPTYLVAQDGDTATQDLYREPILGPCLILDLAERATYYDNGEDGELHERVLITSGSQIDADREYISQSIGEGVTARKSGHVVTVYARLEVAEETEYRQVGTLPEGWRPDFYAVAPAYMAGATDTVYIDVRENGSVSVSSRKFTGTYYATVTFVVP